MKDNGMRGASFDKAGGVAGGASAIVTGTGGGFTKVIFVLVLVASIGLGLFLAGQAAYTEYLRFTGQLELRQAEAETEKLRAQVDLENAAADRARAEGDKIAAEGEKAESIAIGEALKAPALAAARTVDRQSTVVTFWGFITPALFVSMMLLSSCLGGVGGPLALVLLYTALKRYTPEFVEVWKKAKEEYEERKNQADAD